LDARTAGRSRLDQARTATSHLASGLCRALRQLNRASCFLGSPFSSHKFPSFLRRRGTNLCSLQPEGMRCPIARGQRIKTSPYKITARFLPSFPARLDPFLPCPDTSFDFLRKAQNSCRGDG